MPSVKLSLELYVTAPEARRRQDGTYRVLFEVPPRLRPSGWPPTIPLPRAGGRRGDLGDADEVARINADARTLYAELLEARGGVAADAPEQPWTRRGTIPWLIKTMAGERTLRAVMGELQTMAVAIDPGDAPEDWADISPRTRVNYIVDMRHVYAWSLTRQHPHIRTMTPKQARAFLEMWRGKPRQQRNVRAQLTALVTVAMAEEELRTNPLEMLRQKKRKRVKRGRRAPVGRWARSEVDAYARVARSERAWREHRAGNNPDANVTWPGGSRLVQLMYETAADSTDAITWIKGEGGHFVDDPNLPGIDFDRGKTDTAGFIPISQALAAEIRASGTLYLVTDPLGRPYTPVIDDARLRGHLDTLRLRAVAGGAPRRIYDHLRHTAATEAVEMGIDLDDVRNLTTHKNSEMNRKVYVQRSTKKAIEIQRARGIIP